ncbi:MAG TPA: slipin family protein, partial [Accumulibacter sp.]|nr:slipin family protein [Accumulibacter sp.]
MLKRFIVKKNERAALLRNGDFQRILDPGRHYFFDPFNELSLTIWHTDTPMLDSDLVDYLRQNEPAEAERHFVGMALNEDEVGLRYENEVLVEVLAPATRRFFWRGLVAQRLEKIDLRAGAALPPDMV